MPQTYANSPDELAKPADLAGLSGLEIMQAMATGKLPDPPIARTLGYHISDVADGRVVFSGTATFDFCNPMGGVHGGWYGTLLDSCMACAVMTKVPVGHHYTTLEYKVNITRALPLGVQIDAIGMIQHVGRSTGVAVGEIRGREDGKLYATGSTTCIIMKG